MGRPPSDAEFTEFVHATWPSLYRTAWLILGDTGLAEDLVQTALGKTYAAWPRIHDLEAAPAYARRTLVTTSHSWFRKRSWRERATGDLPEAAYSTDPSTRPAVVDALRALPPRQREVVVLRYYDDLPVAEVAALLGCSEGTVKSQTHAALRRLRDLLGDAVIPTATLSGAHHD